jgi:RNA polymerase sigma-70 factor, ECF subfamily
MSAAQEAPAASDRPRELDHHRLADQLEPLHRAARRLTRHREDAEDLVQETCARILAKPRVLRGEEDVGYLMRALRNTHLAQQRTRQRRPVLVPLVDDPASGAGGPHAALEAREALSAVAALPEAARRVVTAVDVLGLSYGETARALGVPEGTVMSRLSRARGRVALSLSA